MKSIEKLIVKNASFGYSDFRATIFESLFSTFDSIRVIFKKIVI